LREPGATGLAAISAQTDRWFLWTPVALCAGIAAYFALPVEPPGAVFAIVLGLGALCGVAARRGLALPVTLALALACAGFVLAKARMEAVAAPAIERRMGPVVVRALVEDADPARGKQMRVMAQVLSVEGLAADATPRRLLLMLPGVAGLEPGAEILAKVTLVPLLTPVTPGGHDPALAQWFAGIGGTGFARDAPAVLAEPEPGFWLQAHTVVTQIRAGMGGRIQAVLSGDTAAFAEAIITGERSRLSDAATESMQISGLAHIISISGLHMSLVAGGVFWVVRALLALFPGLALHHPIKKYAAIAGLLAGLFYTVLSGMQVAALRSFLMIAVMFAAVLMDRPALSIRNVAMSALAILLFTPEVLLTASFQMSFLAVTGLVAMHEAVTVWRRGRLRVRAERGAVAQAVWMVARFILLAAATSLVAGLFSGLAAAYHFNRISPYSLLANLVAAPVVSLLVMPMALVSAVLMPLGLEGWALSVLGFGLNALLAISDWTADLPGAAGLVPAQTAAGALLLGLGALWLCLWRERLRLAGLAFMAAGLLVSGLRAEPDILVERTARNAAVRMEDGRLSFADARRGRYAAERWMMATADGDSLGAAAKRGAWACAEGLCETRVKGRRVIYLRGLEGKALACVAGDIVIADFPLRKQCRDAALRIDRFSVWREGAHAVHIAENGAIVVKTAQGERGERPWVTKVKARISPQGPSSQK
jgi:competence protein ComEC